MGLPVLRLPEPDGIGAGLLEATAVAEKIGAVLLPEPAVPTIVFASRLERSSGSSHAPQRAVQSGSRIVALCGFDTVELSRAGEVSGQVQVPDDGVTDAVALLARDHYTAECGHCHRRQRPRCRRPTSRIDVDRTRPAAVIDLDGTEPADVLRLSDRPRRGSAVNLPC